MTKRSHSKPSSWDKAMSDLGATFVEAIRTALEDMNASRIEFGGTKGQRITIDVYCSKEQRDDLDAEAQTEEAKAASAEYEAKLKYCEFCDDTDD